MALPTLYIDTGGTSLGSGSSDATNPTHSSTINSVTVSVSGTTVTFSGALDLSAVPTDGSATIFINDATNSNAKIFKITSVNDGADTLAVSVAPTGSIATSTWGIGGQFVYDSTRFEGAVAAGWTIILNNSPASKSADFFTTRVIGDNADGSIIFRGKTGTRPVLDVSNTTQCLEISNTSFPKWNFENLELVQHGGSGDVVTASASDLRFRNIKISAGGGDGMSQSGGGVVIIGSEITGLGSDGLAQGGNPLYLLGNYIHDNTADGQNNSAATSWAIMFCIYDSNGGRGIYFNGSHSSNTATNILLSNTFYNNGNSGLEVLDADTKVLLYNNVFQDNGNAAGEFNVEWAAGNADLLSMHGYNCFYHQGAGGGANLSALTTNSTEITTDPLLINPGPGDFSLHAQSPCRMTGYPGLFLGGPTGYLDMGAVQGRHIINPTYNIGI